MNTQINKLKKKCGETKREIKTGHFGIAAVLSEKSLDVFCKISQSCICYKMI